MSTMIRKSISYGPMTPLVAVNAARTLSRSGGMYFLRKPLEGQRLLFGDIPKRVAMTVHEKCIGIHLPGPKSHSRRLERTAKFAGRPIGMIVAVILGHDQALLRVFKAGFVEALRRS